MGISVFITYDKSGYNFWKMNKSVKILFSVYFVALELGSG